MGIFDRAMGSVPTTMSCSNNTGRWTVEEHELFVKFLLQVGKDWKKISERIQTRTAVQVRTHAQKYFLKLSNASERPNKTLSELERNILRIYARSNEENENMNQVSCHHANKRKMHNVEYSDENSERHNKCFRKEKIQSAELDLFAPNKNTSNGLFVPYDGAICKTSKPTYTSKVNKYESKPKVVPMDYSRELWGEHMIIPYCWTEDMLRQCDKENGVHMDFYEGFQLEPLLDDAALDLLYAM